MSNEHDREMILVPLTFDGHHIASYTNIQYLLKFLKQGDQLIL